MAIHLLGGGWAEDERAWTGQFVDDARARAGGPPRIVVVLWAPTVSQGEQWHDDYRDDLRSLGADDIEIVQLSAERKLTPEDFTGADGVFVGGGLTPGYHTAIMPSADALRRAVDRGVAYAGFSAGAMIAGRQALLGGWRIGGVPVAPERAAEGLDEIALADGLGLVDFVVDVHAAQAGTLSRAVAIVTSGLAERSVAIDECTSLIVSSDTTKRTGLGNVWTVSRGETGVEVSVRSAGWAARTQGGQDAGWLGLGPG